VLSVTSNHYTIMAKCNLNPWVVFLKLNGGKGFTRAQLSQKYKADVMSTMPLQNLCDKQTSSKSKPTKNKSNRKIRFAKHNDVREFEKTDIVVDKVDTDSNWRTQSSEHVNINTCKIGKKMRRRGKPKCSDSYPCYDVETKRCYEGDEDGFEFRWVQPIE
jgi:hypothetical protein